MTIFENNDGQTHEDTVQQLQNQVQCHALFSEIIKHPKDLFPHGITNFIRDSFLGKKCVINEEGVVQSSSLSPQFSSLGVHIHRRIEVIVEEARYRDTISNISSLKVQRTKTKQMLPEKNV